MIKKSKEYCKYCTLLYTISRNSANDEKHSPTTAAILNSSRRFNIHGSEQVSGFSIFSINLHCTEFEKKDTVVLSKKTFYSLIYIFQNRKKIPLLHTTFS